MIDHKCAAVPLAEQLRSVPRDAVLRIDTPNALGCMDTRSIPVGRLCHEAADALGMPVVSQPQHARRCKSVSECPDWDHCSAVGECCPPETAPGVDLGGGRKQG